MKENMPGEIEVALESPQEVTEAAENIEAEVTQPAEKQENKPEGEEVKKKRNSGFHKKINKLEQQLLEERNARLALEEKLKPQNSAEKPNIDNFESFDAYNEALLDWKVEQREAQREKRIKEQEDAKLAAVQAEEVKSSWARKEESLGEDYDDYQDLVAQHQSTSFRQDLIQATYESDLGPQIRYYLLKNPEELAKINKSPAELSSYAIFKKIAELETKLSQPPVNKVSKSSEPITPVRGTAKTSVNLDKISDADQWIAQRHPHLYGRK